MRRLESPLGDVLETVSKVSVDHVTSMGIRCYFGIGNTDAADGFRFALVSPVHRTEQWRDNLVGSLELDDDSDRIVVRPSTDMVSWSQLPVVVALRSERALLLRSERSWFRQERPLARLNTKRTDI